MLNIIFVYLISSYSLFTKKICLKPEWILIIILGGIQVRWDICKKDVTSFFISFYLSTSFLNEQLLLKIKVYIDKELNYYFMQYIGMPILIAII